MNLTLVSYTQVSNNDSPETFKRLEPVSITDMQTHAALPTLLIPPADDPLYIETLIAAAREQVERYECGIQLLDAIYELSLDAFPGTVANVPSWLDDSTLRPRGIKIPKPPFQELISVKYDDSNGEEQIIYDNTSPLLDSGVVRLDAPTAFNTPLRMAELYEANGQTWVTALAQRNTVRIRYRCGFGELPTDVPAAIRMWIMIAAATMYAHRESEVIGAAHSKLDYVSGLLDPWRVERSIV